MPIGQRQESLKRGLHESGVHHSGSAGPCPVGPTRLATCCFPTQRAAWGRFGRLQESQGTACTGGLGGSSCRALRVPVAHPSREPRGGASAALDLPPPCLCPPHQRVRPWQWEAGVSRSPPPPNPGANAWLVVQAGAGDVCAAGQAGATAAPDS